MHTPAQLTRALTYLQAIGYRVKLVTKGYWRVESPDGQESWLLSADQLILFVMMLPSEP